jgi:hypothetical protein
VRRTHIPPPFVHGDDVKITRGPHRGVVGVVFNFAWDALYREYRCAVAWEGHVEEFSQRDLALQAVPERVPTLIALN